MRRQRINRDRNQQLASHHLHEVRKWEYLELSIEESHIIVMAVLKMNFQCLPKNIYLLGKTCAMLL